MAIKVKKTITIRGESFFVLRFPLSKATHVFDILLKTYGKALISILTKVFSGGSGEGKISFNDFESSLSGFMEGVHVGQTIQFLEAVIDPDFVKYKNEPVALNDLHKSHGLMFIFKLVFEVIKFNFEDFFFFSEEKGKSKDTQPSQAGEQA